MFRGRSSSGRAPPCQGGGSEFEPRRPLHCKQDIRLGVLFFVRRKNSLPPPAPKAHLIRGEAGCREASSGLAGERLEQGASEARKRPGGAFAARCACHGTAVPRASLVARSKKHHNEGCGAFSFAKSKGWQRRWRCTGQRGCSLSQKRTPPLYPPEKGLHCGTGA